MKRRTEAATSRSGDRALAPWIALGIVAAVFLVYGQTVRNAFLALDDEPYIFGNPHVMRGLTWQNARWALTTFHESNWHPLTWLSHMLDVEMFGLAPGGHHLTSAAIHAASAALLFFFWRRATGRVWPSAAVGLLFAVHPLHVESVAWAAERKDVLAGFFWMATLLAYGEYARRGGPVRYAQVVASFALGLLAKPTLVTLPFVLLLLDAWPFGRWGASVGPSRGMVLLEKAPLLALSIASSAVTVVAQSAGRSTSDLATISLASRFANAAVSCVWYLVKSVWPTRLAVLYPHPALAFPEESSAQLALGAAAAFALAGATLLAVGVRRDRPFVLFGWLWYLGTLVPVLGLVQVGNQARADRYAYIPLIGISVIVAWEACRQVDRRPALRASVVAGAAAAMAALGVAAGVQAALWRDGITLFRHALSVTGRNYLMHYNLGRTLERAGRLEEAEAEHRAALALRPGFALARYNYASFLRSRGDWTAARAEYEEAVRLDPSLLEARSDLGTLLATLGDRTAARAQFEECLRRAPRFAPAWYNLGILRSGEGDVAGAEAAFAEALRIQPDHAPAMNGLAAVLLRQGKLEESLRWGEAAVRLRDDSFQAWFNVGIASLELARVARARAAFERAVALDPRNARARHNLARALEREGRIAEAAEMYERAARLDPGLHEALDALRRIRGAP